jgi:hypothetical protein
MITITDDYRKVIINTDDYMFLCHSEPTEGFVPLKKGNFIELVYNRNERNKNILLSYKDKELQQKVWDRLCEITGARDIFDDVFYNYNGCNFEVLTRGGKLDIDEPDPEPETRYI